MKKLIFLVVLFLCLVPYIQGQDAQEAEDPLEGLRRNIPGEPGKDYPIFSIDILCKINPGQCGGGRGGGGKNKKKNGNNAAAAGGR